MVESVYTTDLKSVGPRPCGFKSRRPHQNHRNPRVTSRVTIDKISDIVTEKNLQVIDYYQETNLTGGLKSLDFGHTGSSPVVRTNMH